MPDNGPLGLQGAKEGRPFGERPSFINIDYLETLDNLKKLEILWVFRGCEDFYLVF